MNNEQLATELFDGFFFESWNLQTVWLKKKKVAKNSAYA